MLQASSRSQGSLELVACNTLASRLGAARRTRCGQAGTADTHITANNSICTAEALVSSGTASILGEHRPLLKLICAAEPHSSSNS